MLMEEKEQHAWEFLRWAVHNDALFSDLRQQCVEKYLLDFLELLQLLYDNGFYEACILCIFLAREEPYVCHGIYSTIEEALRARWQSRGSEAFLKDLLEKIRAAEQSTPAAAGVV